MPGTSPSIIHSLNSAYIFLSNTFLKAASFKSLRVNFVSCHDHDREGSWYTFVLIYIQQVLERVIYASVQFSRSVVSDSLQPHRLRHARPPCPSPTPEVYPDSCPLSRWCHPTVSSSVIPFSSCLQSSPASGSFPMSRFFASGGQSIGVQL